MNVKYFAQQRILRPGFKGPWNDLPVADSVVEAEEEITRNKDEISAVEGLANLRVLYRVVRREDTVVREDEEEWSPSTGR